VVVGELVAGSGLISALGTSKKESTYAFTGGVCVEMYL